MKRLMLIQHEAFEPLGTLDPVIRQQGVGIKFVNFEHHPDVRPTMEKYQGLILMGGYMGVYESHIYDHLNHEMKLIEEALKRELPILGICLGSQILAHVLGARVQKHTDREMGWYDVHFTEAATSDPLLGDFKPCEKLFQSHGDVFDIPSSAVHLASSDLCMGQAFRYGKNVYGIQFHLEIDQPTIDAWFQMPENIEIFQDSRGVFQPDVIRADTSRFLPRSMDLSRSFFFKFLEMNGSINKKKKSIRLGSDR
jgi:GMP synthase (glutamine-hydrolysing)